MGRTAMNAFRILCKFFNSKKIPIYIVKHFFAIFFSFCLSFLNPFIFSLLHTYNWKIIPLYCNWKPNKVDYQTTTSLILVKLIHGGKVIPPGAREHAKVLREESEKGKLHPYLYSCVLRLLGKDIIPDRGVMPTGF